MDKHASEVLTKAKISILLIMIIVGDLTLTIVQPNCNL